jgi:riboflavin synthase
MFTGIVSAVGVIAARRETAEALEFEVDSDYESLVAGESIAVNGACVTVVRPENGRFRVQVVETTARLTNFGDFETGTRVNLERAMQLGDRLGGHWVQGHVDGVGEIVGRVAQEDALLLDVRVPPAVHSRTINRGSITIDGVSLTVIRLKDDEVVQVSLIPFTRDHTTLGEKEVGDMVHIEGDVLGTYVERLLSPRIHDES